MKRTTKVLSALVLIVAFGVMILHTAVVGVQTWNAVTGDLIDWSLFGGAKMAIVALRALATLALLVMMMVFVCNIRKGGGRVFVRRNVALFYWSLLPFVVYSFCEVNIPIVSGVRQWVVDTDTVLGACALLLFALAYHRGVVLTEEDGLTI